MLKLRHRHDETDDNAPDVAPEAEARIRADERRRVLADREGLDAPGDGVTEAPLPPPSPHETPLVDQRDDPRVVRPRDDERPDGHDDLRHRDEPRHREEPRHLEEPRHHEEVATHEEVLTERGFSPGQLLILAAGAASIVLGVLAVLRTGLGGALSEPVETVLWWDHTALLGLVEIGAGALLVIGALHPALRWLGAVVGIAAIVGGVLVLAEADWAMDELGTEPGFGWAAIVIGAVALLGALVPRVRRTRHVTVLDD